MLNQSVYAGPRSDLTRSENERAAVGDGDKEYVCKIRATKKPPDYSTYEFYDTSKTGRMVRFLHRCASNVFLRGYLKAIYRVKVVGKENVAALKKSGAVVVSNHIHPLDIQMISTFVFGMRPVHWLTLSRNFELNVRCFIRNSGGVPIPEDHDNKVRCFNQMNELLQNKGILHICPEGSLVELCDDIRPFKDGAFRFAFQNRVPVVPVTLRFEEYGKKGKKYRHPKFIIDVAEPLYPVVPQEKLKEKAQRVMKNRCNKLSPRKVTD